LIYNKIILAGEDSISLDIAVHGGTLLAVIFFLKQLIIDSFRLTKDGENKANINFLIFFATLPIIIVAIIFEFFLLIDFSRQLMVIALSNIFFSILLYFSDQKQELKSISDLTIKDAIIIGLWQSFSLFPGTSRSGSTITGARFLNYKRKDSILISLLMGIPAIGCSLAYLALKISQNTENFNLFLLFVAGIFSFVFALIALKTLLRFSEVFSFTPFVVYRILLGIFILILISI
jgi:undecaprenyl-diphosphatase